MSRLNASPKLLLKCTAVPRNFNKDCCWVTSLLGGERRRQTFKLSPKGVHSDPQGNNLRCTEEKPLQVLFKMSQQSETSLGTLPEFIQGQRYGQQRTVELAIQC